MLYYVHSKEIVPYKTLEIWRLTMSKVKFRVWFNNNDEMDWHDVKAVDAESAADNVIDNIGNPESIFLVEEWRSDMPVHQYIGLDEDEE